MTRSPKLLPALAPLLLATTLAFAQAQPTPAQPAKAQPTTAPVQIPGLDMPIINNGQLTELAAQIVIVHDVPGVVIALIDKTGVRAIGSAGVRQSGRPDRIEPEDAFHLGSCGKAMTATLLARLAEQGKLSLSDTLPKLLPDLKLDPAYANVTLLDLLQHRSGLAGDKNDAAQLPFLRASANDPRAARASLAQRLLTQAPDHAPGTFQYSNCGYAIAGHIAERVTGKPFEQLLREEVFTPLSITSGGFGAPGANGNATTTRPNSAPDKIMVPFGHRLGAVPALPGPLADNPAGLAPAGTMHMAIRDWARFAAIHLGGTPEPVTAETPATPPVYLTPATLALLHAPPTAADGSEDNPTYAAGWGVTRTRGRVTLTHAGSNTLWFSQVLLLPQDGWGILVATNIGGDAGQKACLEATKELISLSQ